MSPIDQASARTRAERILPWAITLVAGLSFGAFVSAVTVEANLAEISQYFLVVQDVPFLLVTALVCPVIGWLLTRDAPLPFAGMLKPRRGAHAVAFAAVVVAVAAWIGAHVVYRSFGLSLDEFMADFDARIIAAGRLLAPIPTPWRDYLP